jgi:preprotein translocase subunit SecE
VSKAQVAKRRRNFVSRIAHETVAELRKVTWPTRQDATQLTLLVLAVVIVASAVLGTLDFLFARVMAIIISIG